jgi:transcriptional regulator with XRE-family HTH domain
MDGASFRRLRLELGLSQTVLGQRMGRSRQYIWQMEQHPEPDEIAVLALKRIADEIRSVAA